MKDNKNGASGHLNKSGIKKWLNRIKKDKDIRIMIWDEIWIEGCSDVIMMISVNGWTYFRPLGSSSTLLPCTKPIRDSSESSSQAEAFITNRPCSPSTPNVHCHRMHSISYLRQQMQRCISFPIPGNRCRISSLYNCGVSPALDRTSSISPTDWPLNDSAASPLTVMSPGVSTPGCY